MMRTFCSVSFVCATAILLATCTGNPAQKVEPETATPAPISIDTTPDLRSVIAHPGEGTGMSVLELIVKQNNRYDTLALPKTNEFSGEHAVICGAIRNYTDRFVFTLSSDSTSWNWVLNLTQLLGHWHDIEHKECGFALTDSVISPLSDESPDYFAWNIRGERLLLHSMVKGETGEAARTDTLEILRLDDDTLTVRNQLNQTLTYVH